MATVDEVSAKAGQFVVMTYPLDAPTRQLMDGHSEHWKREVTLTTEQAVDLYNDLRHALFD
jgi:hypothetical protein